MRLFVQFAPKFLWWPLAAVRDLSERRPGVEVSALVTGGQRVVETVRAAPALRGARVDWLDDLEREWLRTPVDEERWQGYERRLGAHALKRILIADRNVGIGFVESGAVMAQTGLMDAMRDDEMIRRYVFGVLDYAFRTLQRERPDLAFFYAVAGAPAMALSTVCRHLGIPILRYSNARIGSMLVIDDGQVQSLESVRMLFEQARRDPGLVADALPRARRFLAEFRERPEHPQYTYYVRGRARKERGIGSLLRGTLSDLRQAASSTVRGREYPLRTPSSVRRARFNLRVGLAARRLAARWPYDQGRSVPEGPFAYFPMQRYPESNTMVFAPMHTNQFSVIEHLAKSLPLGMKLAVKENPLMLGRRPRGYYETIAGLPDVVLVPPDLDSLHLIRRARLTAVITGTAAWEAIVFGRPALIVGNSPFLALPGGHVYCPELNRLPDAVQRALALDPLDEGLLELYVACLFSRAVEFPPSLFQTTATVRTVQEHPEIVEHLVCALLERLDAPPAAKATAR